MSLKEITNKVRICDVCGREGFSGTCEVCGKEYCYTCEYIGYNPFGIRICKEHQNNEDMKAKIQSFQKEYDKLRERCEKKISNLDELQKIVAEKIKKDKKGEINKNGQT